jgi:hypothetical protein
MSYFETSRLKDTEGDVINPASDEGLTLLRRIFQLLKPLGQITGGGSNRLSVDINNVVGGTIGTVSTVNTVSTVTTVTNHANIANISAFDLMKATSRTAYNTGNRSNITF